MDSVGSAAGRRVLDQLACHPVSSTEPSDVKTTSMRPVLDVSVGGGDAPSGPYVPRPLNCPRSRAAAQAASAHS